MLHDNSQASSPVLAGKDWMNSAFTSSADRDVMSAPCLTQPRASMAVVQWKLASISEKHGADPIEGGKLREEIVKADLGDRAIVAVGHLQLYHGALLVVLGPQHRLARESPRATRH